MNTTEPRSDPEVLLKPPRFGEIEPISRWRFHSVPDVVIGRRTVVVILACLLAFASAWIAMSYPPRPALALFVAMIGAVAIFVDPFLGVLAYVTLAFMRPQETLWGLADTRLTYLVSLSTLVSACLHFAGKPDLDFLRKKQCFLVAILWLFIYLSTIFGDFGEPEPKWMDYYNKMFLIYFVILAVTTSERKLLLLAGVATLSIGYSGDLGEPDVLPRPAGTSCTDPGNRGRRTTTRTTSPW